MKKKILLTKGALDGHDKGIQVVAQALRNAGMEIVYGGLYCSPEEIVEMALQEDVDMIGISMLSGAHLGVFSETLKILKEKTEEDWFVFGGGVIPQKDIVTLEKMGVKRIFLPGTLTQDITNFVLEAQIMTKDWSDLIKRVKNGETLAASRLMTLIQRGDKKAKKAVAKFSSLKKDILLIGVTGPGGVGKSTLIDQLIRFFRKEKKTVGVLVCDPVSTSGGAFLGDRVRMQKHTLDQGVFVRSLAQHDNFKGVIPEIPDLVKIFGALKKDVIIVETVGVGQEDLGFRDMVETLIYTSMPGLGDEIQLLKGGVVETADFFVINQGDKLGADRTFQYFLSHTENVNQGNGWQPKVYKTNSLTGEGILELVNGIKKHKKFLLNQEHS